MSNILILSAGRRVELVQSFREELNKISPTALVITTDINPKLSAACQVADRFVQVPRVTDESYIDCLMDICIDNNINLVIPTIDTELILMSRNREKFKKNDINIVISDEKFIETCSDKRKTSQLFTEIGLVTPEIYSRDAIRFPCFAKPYDGSLSAGAIALISENMLSKSLLDNDKMIFMELVDKRYTEYTIDVYYDRNSNLRCLVPRERIEVRCGEISKGATRRNVVYDYLLPKLRYLEGARGCITLQIFADIKNSDFLAIEINPRFGGGYPLSYSAGANYPRWLICEYLQDENIDFYDQWETDLLMLRYDAKIIKHGYS